MTGALQLFLTFEEQDFSIAKKLKFINDLYSILLMYLKGNKLKKYLAEVFQTKPSKIRILKLENSRTNIIYKFFFKNRVYIAKQYLPYVAKIPQIKIGLARVLCEHNSIKLLSRILGPQFVPDIIHFSVSSNYSMLIMGYKKSNYFFGNEKNYEKLKKRDFLILAVLLTKLHSDTKGKPNLIKPKISSITDYDLSRTATAQKFYKKEVLDFKKALNSYQKSIVWGDCCPKNLIIHNRKICLIDFEFCHYNSPIIDIGFFLAHIILFITQHNCYKNQLIDNLKSFIQSYKKETKLHSINILIDLSFVYAGIVLVHKIHSKAKYKISEKHKKLIANIAAKLIKKQITSLKDLENYLT